MRVHVLGSAAGGGFPQWNCNCRNCAGLRQGAIPAQARTQSSIAVGNGEDWVLFNAGVPRERGCKSIENKTRPICVPQ